MAVKMSVTVDLAVAMTVGIRECYEEVKPAIPGDALWL